jgi:hypothetical protein
VAKSFFINNLICDLLSILKLIIFLPLRYLNEYTLLEGWNEIMVPLPQQQQLIEVEFVVMHYNFF